VIRAAGARMRAINRARDADVMLARAVSDVRVTAGRDRLQRVAWVAALALPALVTLISIIRLGVNVPFWDQWTMAPLLKKFHDGSLGFHDFWAQHNEHRPLFPRAIDLGLAQATNWDIRAELYLNFAVAAGGFLVFVAALRRTLDRTEFMVASIVAAFIYFSLFQWENWLWGWQLGWFLSGIAAAGAMWALAFVSDRPWRWSVALAGACGVLATYSLGNGLLVWPAGVVVLALLRKPMRVWIALGILTSASYLYRYHNPPGLPSKMLFLHHPVQFGEFVLLYLGRMFAPGTGLGIAVGAALLASFGACMVHVIRHRDDDGLVDRAAFWAGLGAYALGGALLTSVARLGFGLEQAPSSRYTTVAALFAVATMALVFVVLRSPEAFGRTISQTARWRSSALVAALLVLAVIGNTPAGLRALRQRSDALGVLADCVHRAQSPGDDCLRTHDLGPNLTPQYVAYVFGGIEYLRSERLGGF
jgi:hypothetical protein